MYFVIQKGKLQAHTRGLEDSFNICEHEACSENILTLFNIPPQGYSARKGRTVDGRKEKAERREEKEGSWFKEGL